jgi:protein-L-isoaspartate(D-aspartate) O-methyltransferase
MSIGLVCGFGLSCCNNDVPPPPSKAHQEADPSTSPARDAIRKSDRWMERREEREWMVKHHIRSRGVVDPRVLETMVEVPRHLFVPETIRHRAYDDRSLPIGKEQTISQPYIVAFMTEKLKLKPDHKVLEIGTGSGYQAAVLAELAREVYTIEIISSLGKRSRALLESLGYENIHFRIGDGYQGWREAAPFDAVIVTAAPDHLPPALVEQLKPGGRLIIPVGGFYQELILVTKTDKGVEKKSVLPVVFVPMTGEAQDR